MFDEPEERPPEHVLDPQQRDKEKAEEFRMYAELGAVFEGTRKFEAQILSLSSETARDLQKRMARLEKSKTAGTPVLTPESIPDASALLDYHHEYDFPTNHYHAYRRPGELMIARWIEGDEVETFYERMQAHFDVALDGYKEEEHQQHDWKKDAKTTAYLAALDAINVKAAEAYLRDAVKKHNLFVLSTVTTDEMNIAWLCEDVMGLSPGEVLGEASAPPDEPSEQDLAWFFKLFSLRGTKDGVERMCFFAFLQKSDDSSW